MDLSLTEVEKIAKLSRINFSDDEKQKLRTEVVDILNYVDQIQELTGKSAMQFDEDPDALNLMRDDVAEQVSDPQKFLSQAPAKEGKYLKVKSILE